jgi:GntR family transcriptional regulator
MISVDTESPVPPFEQIRTQLTDHIRSGQLGIGQRLPSIRQLAGDLRVATGTVARAYTELETAGLIETSRATGARVRADQTINNTVQRAASKFVQAALRNSLTLDDALSAIRSEWAAR